MIEAGKNVLCEKPLTMNLKQAKAIIALAREKKVFFMEVRNHFLFFFRSLYRHISFSYRHSLMSCLVHWDIFYVYSVHPPAAGSSKAGYVMPYLYGTLHIKDLLPLFEKSRVVIMVVGFSSSSHSYSHSTLW